MSNTTPDRYRDVRVELHYFDMPEIESLLELNTRNRRPNERTQRMFRSELRAGRAYLSDSAIVLSNDDPPAILNGQNRLMAAQQEGIGFWGFLATGVPEESQLIMDTGGRRTFAQHLTIVYGEPNATEKQALVTALWKYENGNYGFRGNWFNRPDPKITDLDRLWGERGEDVSAAIKVADRARRGVEYSKTALGLLRLLTVDIDREDSDHFFERITTDVGHSAGDAALAARTWIRGQVRSAGPKPSTEQQVAILIKAWNRYREGEPVQQLRYRPGGANPESYPTPL